MLLQEILNADDDAFVMAIMAHRGGARLKEELKVVMDALARADYPTDSIAAIEKETDARIEALDAYMERIGIG